MSLPDKFTALLAQGKGIEPKLEELPLQKPGKNQVLVKVLFAPINPSDVMNIQGTYPIPIPFPNPVGWECSGTVVAVGEELRRSHQIGDQVHVVSLGTFGQYILADSESCRKIQEGLSLEEAACHCANPATTVGMGHLVTKAGVKAVIHTSGSSALGRMMIRYFKHKGIKTINIVRKDSYIEELKQEGADYVLNSQAPDFEQTFKEIVHKEEATIAFEAVAGDLTAKIIKNQPPNSTCYLYGALAGEELSNFNVQQFIFEGKTLTGFLLNPYFQKIGPEEVGKIMDEAYELLPTILKSNIQKVFKLEEYKEALAYHEQHSSKGKILLKPN